MESDFEIIEFINFDLINKKKKIVKKKKRDDMGEFILVSEYRPCKKYNLLDQNISESITKIDYYYYISEIEKSYKYIIQKY